MRLLSNIIKGERIRAHGIIDLSKRIDDENGYMQMSAEQNIDTNMQQEDTSFQEKAKEEAEVLLQAASEQAGQIVNDAKEQANSLLEQANAQKEALLEEIRQIQSKQETELLEKQKKLEEEIEAKRQEMLMQIQPQVTEMVKDLLQYIIGEEIYHQTDWVACVVKKMLMHPAIKGEIVIGLSPTLYNKLDEQEKQKLLELKSEVALEIEDDLEETICTVKTPQGNILYNPMETLQRVLNDIHILQNIQ